MNDSVLWAVALGSGALGLLLLAVAGAVAVYWNTGARGARDTASGDQPRSRGGDITATEKSQPPTSSPNAQPATAGGLWTWVKACVFAFFHAGIVSVVLGGITFFEDLAKASGEIQNTGTVTFPKQLLPGTLSGSASRKSLSQPANASSPGATAWEVVDMMNESSDGDGD
ncbi:MAG: hypothetical protein SXV54_23810 [Chloroflexota bacterium]|nr:hypothetical protein [Chloroflexota bacterium]